MRSEPQTEQLPKEDLEDRYNGIFCIGCCAPSERWWFRWVLPAQPVIALVLYLYYYVSWD